MALRWTDALEKVRKFSFKINTPQGSGSGFLITLRKQHIFGVATAYHVIDHSYLWEEPIKLLHTDSNQTFMLQSTKRFIFAKPDNDAALILFDKGDLQIESDLLTLAPEGKYLRPGMEIAWAGYPAIAPNEFSYFNGHVSCYLHSSNTYLVDGVAINGVSGGPTFTMIKDDVHVIGIVSAYIPNRATGESLPGVCCVTDIKPFHEFIKDIKTLEEAREKAREK